MGVVPTKRAGVDNADASFDMMGLEAMIAETPTKKKVKRNIKERPQMTPEQSDDIKKRIVNYIKDLPYRTCASVHH